MKIKTDENIGRRGVEFLRRSGHDVMTVREQNLAGADDSSVFRACSVEARVLVTLDRDFGQVLRFPPRQSAGIVILDLGGAASMQQLIERLAEFHALATTRPVHGALWIVEPGRVRIHLERDEE